MKNLTPPKSHFSRHFGPWGVRICKNLEIENFWFRSRQKWLSPRSLGGCRGQKPNTPQKPLFSTFWTMGIIFKQKIFFSKKKIFFEKKLKIFFAQKPFFSTFWTMGSPNMQKKNFGKIYKTKGGTLWFWGKNQKGPPFGF